MAFQIFSQRDPRWAGHALGSGAGELGAYGCLETCLTMVYNDAYKGAYNPATFDDLLWADKGFSGDLLPDNALDRAFPGHFQTTVTKGWDQVAVNKAVASSDTYAVVCIHNPAVGVNAYHFMVVYSPTTVADPWWGKVMAFSSWGGPAVAVKVIFIKSLRVQLEAAAAASAKAKADAQAALAAAQAQAAAAEAAAQAAAAADAREAAAHAAADAAARAEAAQEHPASPILHAPVDGWFDIFWTLLVILSKQRL